MIAVAGAGAFGTALAVALSANGAVTLWARSPDTAAEMAKTRENKERLPGIELPESVTVTSDPEELLKADTILLSMPAQTVRAFVESHRDRLDGTTLVACCKGIDLETLTGAAGTVAESLPGAVPAVLTGPSFAADIARGLPTALTLACARPEEAIRLQESLSTPCLRLYRTSDVVGAELGGALKNVIAIACGACIGKGYGVSARAALMTRGFAEMQRLAAHRGADPVTLMGLSGFGDLTLTCTSDMSRNYRFGLAWGAGEDFDTSATVEGVKTAQAVARLSREQGIDMPITRLVADVVDGEIDISDALGQLLSRPLKEE
ncbi:NAD(P)H-dependent glycerol-3-phosphate dehydrogenase [Histidinibacterium aquaticum]|uniref:Glycerol-3-phosphate dehydrogenase [NAD(P)+] n=1 Tax=Histidinibacterium aquaticum TaxID=2613962 RepID=A0A5J5GG99_9RHOB|nr:NAD(P)H-dependent glycerol-3-phosphate dehydrogenase [Histidinibacterium aquaticum]KAA9006753.1 NAD(P)-dependent glycerol-3-phosphate dehydrogenase [Histidinibacterium aquaticum]